MLVFFFFFLQSMYILDFRDPLKSDGLHFRGSRSMHSLWLLYPQCARLEGTRPQQQNLDNKLGLPWQLSCCKESILLRCWRQQFDPWVGKILWRRDRLPTPVLLGFPGGSNGEESACHAEYLGLIPWVRKILWRREQLPTLLLLPGESHGQRSLVGYNPQGRRVGQE